MDGYGNLLLGPGEDICDPVLFSGCDLCPSYPVGPVSRTLAMCSSEEADLLRLEEIFLTTLARTNSLILQPLLLAGESGPEWGREGAQERPPGRFLPP